MGWQMPESDLDYFRVPTDTSRGRRSHHWVRWYVVPSSVRQPKTYCDIVFVLDIPLIKQYILRFHVFHMSIISQYALKFLTSWQKEIWQSYGKGWWSRPENAHLAMSLCSITHEEGWLESWCLSFTWKWKDRCCLWHFCSQSGQRLPGAGLFLSSHLSAVLSLQFLFSLYIKSQICFYGLFFWCHSHFSNI